MTSYVASKRMNTVTRVAAGFLGLVSAAAAAAQAQPKGDVYDQFFRYTESENKVLFQERPGETVDPFTGNLRIVQQDLALPGKAGLDLHIVRSYSSKIWGRADGLATDDPLLAEKAKSVLGYGWTFHMGRLINPDGTGDAGTCSSNLPVFEGGDGSAHSFYKSAWSSAVLLSKDYWRYERNCTAMAGAGACAWSDAGTRYEFSSSANDAFYVGMNIVWPLTGIVDQFGNRISVSYVAGTGAVDTITDTWGRTVQFSYLTAIGGRAVEDGRRLDKMTVADGSGSASKVYQYSYTWIATGATSGAGQSQLPGTGRYFLGAVQPPAGPPQSYEYAYGVPVANNQYALKTLTYPGGATTTYTYSKVDFFTGREVVPFSVVTQRVAGGRNVPPAIWGYSYVSPQPIVPPPADPELFPFHVTTITRPDGKLDVFRMYGFGWIATKTLADANKYTYAFLVGLTKKISRADGAEVEEMGWDARTAAPVTTQAAYAAPVYSDTCGTQYTVWDAVVLAPALTRRVLHRDGAAYVTDSTDFDGYGQPKTVTETGYQASKLSYSDGRPDVTLVAAGTQVRTTTWTYASFPAEKYTGAPLNLLRGLPLTQKVCVGTDCADNAWTYDTTSATPGYPRKTETRSGVTTTFGYHPAAAEGVGNLESVTNALGQKLTLTGYGAGWGIPTNIDFNGAFTMSRTAYWEGWVKTVTDGRNNTTAYAYDAIGRPLTVTPPGNGANAPTVTSYATDDSWATTTRGSYTKTTYLDGLGRTTESSDTEGFFTSVRYDPMGQGWFKSYPYDATTGEVGEKQFFDGLGRVTAQTHAFRPTAGAIDQSGTCETPGACMVWNTYANNCVETTVERTSTETPRTLRCGASFGNPDDQRLAAVGDSHGSLWQYTYGASDNLLAVLAPLSQGGRSYTYYPVTRFLQDETTGESGRTGYTRNAIGQVLTRTDARSVVATLGYSGTNGVDPLGRLRSVTYQNGSADDLTQSWDNANNLSTIGSPNGGAYTFVYDELNRVTQQTWSFNNRSYITGYHYDVNGCLDTVTQPTGRTLTMTCDTANRPTSVKLGNDSIVTVITYHPSGQVKSMTYGNGKVTDFVLDDRSRTTSITSGGAIELSYTYDGADNVKTMANGVVANGSLTMEYDLLDRLVASYGPGQGSAGYDYDALGNRTFKTEGNTNHISNYVYDSTTNRLTTATTESPPSALKLTWDLAGRLASTSDGATYKYDARGKRVAKTDASGTTVYHYDAAGRVIAETTPTGDRLRDYVYVGNHLVAVDGCVDGATTPCTAERQWYHTDTLGSVLARTDATGAVVARLDNLPWGEQFSPSGVQGDRQYNGRVYDAGTGFHDYGARLYWPEIGRFISADPLLGDPKNPAGLNRYSYVLNNPYRYTDPTGMLNEAGATFERLQQSQVEQSQACVAGTSSCVPQYAAAGVMGVAVVAPLAMLATEMLPAAAAAAAAAAAPAAPRVEEAVSRLGRVAAQTQRAIQSLQSRVAEHLAKLEAYRADPDAFDNKGFLKNASEAVRQRIIDGRVRHLENEIQNFQKQIETLKSSSGGS